MKELLEKRHGIGEKPNKSKKHLHALVDSDLINKIDELIPSRMRSRFIESCLKREVAELEELNG